MATNLNANPEVTESTLAIMPEDEGTPLTSEDLLNIPALNPPPPVMEKDLDPVPTAGPGGVIAQAAGQPDRESIELKVDGDTISKHNAAVQALMNIPQSKESAVAVIKEITNFDTSKTYGDAASILIQKDPTPVKRKELATDIDIDNGKRTLIPDIMKNLGYKGTSYNDFMNEPNEAAKVAVSTIVENSTKLQETLSKTYDESTHSHQSTLDFVNPIGGEKADGMDIEVWEAVKGLLSGTFDADAFDEQMTSNYGDEWGARFFAWAAKEIAIDGALLLLAATGAGAPLAAAIGVSRKAILVNRLSRAAKRAVYVGVGGGSIQSMQNIALDRDHNLALEVGIRAGGQAAGELVFKAIGQVYRAASGKNRAAIISDAVKGRKFKPINEINMAKIYDGKQFDIAAVPALVRAKIVGAVDRYEEIMGSTTRMIMDRSKASKEVRDSLAAVLGKDTKDLNQIDMDLILNDAIRIRDLSENIRITAFANQDLNSRGMMGHAMASTIGHRENMTQNVELYISKAMAELRKTDGNINLSQWGWMDSAMKTGRVAEVGRTVGQSGDNLFDTTNISNNIAKGMKRMYKDTYGHLTEREKYVVDAITKQGFADHTTYDLLSTTPQGMKIEAKHLTPRVIEAYNKSRFIFDLSHSIKDTDIVASLKGLVKLRDGKHVQILNNKASKKGYVVIQEYSNATWKIKPDEKSTEILKTTWESMNELTTILPYRNGYMPRAYASHNFSVIVMNPGKGTVAREAMFDSGKEAEQYVLDRTARSTKTKAENADGVMEETNDEIVFKLWNNADTGTNGFSASRSQMDLLNAVDAETRPLLREMLDAQGIDEHAAKFILGGLKTQKPLAGHADALTDFGTATSKAGKEKRLAYAKAKRDGDTATSTRLYKEIKESVADDDALPTHEAFMEYISSVAHSAGQNNFRRYVVDDFMGRYGKHLIPGKKWSDPEFGHTLSADLQVKAHAMSRWMNRTFNRSTHLERKFDHVITRFANKFAERAAAGHMGSRAVSWLLDHSPVMSGELTAFMRFSTAFPKLLSLNMAQTFVQMSQIIPSLGAGFARRPGTAFKSILNLPGMGVIQALHSAGKAIPRHQQATGAYKVWRDLQQSGYIADLNMTDTLFNIQRHLDPSIGRQVWEGAKKVGQAPFRVGEGGNRVIGFVMAHGKITADVKAYTRALKKGVKGKKLEKLAKFARGLEGKPMTDADLGTGQFQQIVANRAAITALSMGKAGELEAMSGFGSVAFQFRQVLPKTMSIFDSTQLTGRERFGAMGAMVTMWGTGAIVLGPDILKATDWVVSQVFDTPKDRMLATDAARYSAKVMGTALEDYIEPETTERWLKHGLVSAMTEGEINFTNRIALGNFLGDMVDISHPTDLIVFAAVAKDMTDAVATLGVAEMLNPVSFLMLLEDMGKGESFQEAMARQYEPEGTISKALAGETTFGNMTLQLTRDFGKVFSQMGSISRAMDAAHQDVVVPEIGRKNPMSPTYYTTSNLKSTDVEVNDINQLMLMLGISPGKLVESRSMRETEMIYKEAAKDYTKRIDKRYRAALGDTALQRRLIIEFTDEMNALKHLSVQLGISPTASLQSMQIATRKLMHIILDIGTGGEIRGGKYTPRRNK